MLTKIKVNMVKALSSNEDNLKKNYKLYRKLNSKVITPIKSIYKMCDYKIHLENRDIPVREFEPEKYKSDQAFLFFHGGGWVIGDIDTYTKPCASLANATGRQVFSVDYRLAPENPFPCGLNDCYQAAFSIYKNACKLNLNRDDIILIGDSAGSNLAACISLMGRDCGDFAFKKQILLYPSTYNDHSASSPFESIHKFGNGYWLTSKRLCDYIDLYIRSDNDFNSPYFAPLLAEDLSNQPDSLVITAAFDPLRDEGEEYARRLEKAGNYVDFYRMPGALHGFFTLPESFPNVQKVYKIIEDFLERKD